jgi:hypothetical protein
MEEERNINSFRLTVSLELEQLRYETLQRLALAFFTNQVKTYRVLIIPLSEGLTNEN